MSTVLARGRLAPARVEIETRGDGTQVLRSPVPPPDHPPTLTHHLRHWAAHAPSRVFLAERAGDGWRTLTYAEARAGADAMAAALLRHGHSPARPVATLGDNSLAMALLKLGALQAGIPFLPISPAYSLMSQTFDKLKHVFATMRPSLVYVPAVAPFAKALAALDLTGVTLLTDAPDPDRPGGATIAAWRTETPGADVEAALATVNLDTVSKILLTSGSTGMPKGVLNTQRMMLSNQAAITACWLFLADRPPVLVDWLPWNHTFGANFCFNVILANGGTLYIDAGRPVPGRFDMTVRNLREIAPTMLFNVPRAIDMLLPALEADEGFARHLFADLDIVFYAAAALPRSSWERLTTIARRASGREIPLLSSLGATETAPAVIMCHWAGAWPVPVGLPLPGIEVKLVPTGGKLESRIRGPAVTPGYHGDPERTRDAFDEEGFFKLGDAVKFVDPARPELGLMFDGRVAENFKLTTGTWVHVGILRLAVISAAAPLVQDAVIAGHDRDAVAALLFVNLDACRQAAGLAADAPAAQVAAHPAVLARIAEGLARHNRDNPGSSTTIRRALVQLVPPAIDANEVTDKGYLNQRAVIAHRAAEVERLYAATPDDGVIVP
jgi:feruloyl-CoA synthase